MADPSTTVADRRTGRAALTAGVLLFLAVAPELLWEVQRPDGSVTSMAGFALYLTCWAVGAGALLVALLGIGRGGVLPRSVRIGRRLCLTGAVLLLVFAPVGLVSALVSGTQAEWSFLLFAVGMLLFLPGGIALGLGLRRSGGRAGVWASLLVAAGAVFPALVASASAWHELGLLLFDAAWVALGVHLLTRGRHAAGPALDRAAVG